MTDPENTFLKFFIIDVFSGYFLLEIYPKGVYNKPVLIERLQECRDAKKRICHALHDVYPTARMPEALLNIYEKEVDRIDGKRENYSGTGRILLLLS